MSLPDLTRRIINGAWIAACTRDQHRFSRALKQVEATQQIYLLNLLRRNDETRFSQDHGFSKITSIAEFQQRVPLTPYDALSPYVEAIARGENEVLTSDRVRLFQPTSGSTTGTKFIPWNSAIAKEFRRGINPWVATLYRRKPELLKGTAYWSISPPTTPLQRHGQLRVGFEHDAGYLGFLSRKLFSMVCAVPSDVAECRETNTFRTRTLLSLLADEDLCLISVWSPTFLTTLFEHFIAHADEILQSLSLSRHSRVKKRARFLRNITKGNHDIGLFEQIWPKLKIISCWTHGPSETYAANLRRFIPSVEIQGKGLIATEAFVSLPFIENVDPVLAVTSHFFEFQDPKNDTIFLAHELTVGKEYRVIVTTGGGLYRYPLGDLIRVTGYVENAPCLQFVGRDGFVSDLFGEKLHGVFVEKAVRHTLEHQGIKPRFFLLAPVVSGNSSPCYALFIEVAQITDAISLCDHLENELAENFHYSHCRRLGQLSQVRLFQIQQSTVSVEEVFLHEMLSRGLKIGDVKMAALDRHPDWERRFDGRFVT